MKRLLILCTLFFLVLRIAAQCPGPAQRTALLNLQKAGIVESSRSGQIPLTDACGNLRYAQYTEVDLVPISYTPSSTGNTQNYSEFVTTLSGDIWYLDWQGRGVKLWNNSGGGANDYDWLTISDNTIPDNIADSIYTGKYASVNMRRVWPNAQLLVGDSTGTNGASGIVAGDRSARWGFVRMLDSTWSSIGQEGTNNAIRLGPGTTAFKISVAAGPSPSQATAPFRDVASFYTNSLIRFNDYPNTRRDTQAVGNMLYTDEQGYLRSRDALSGGAINEPNKQVVFGTGSGIDSDTTLTMGFATSQSGQQYPQLSLNAPLGVWPYSDYPEHNLVVKHGGKQKAWMGMQRVGGEYPHPYAGIIGVANSDSSRTLEITQYQYGSTIIGKGQNGHLLELFLGEAGYGGYGGELSVRSFTSGLGAKIQARKGDDNSGIMLNYVSDQYPKILIEELNAVDTFSTWFGIENHRTNGGIRFDTRSGTNQKSTKMELLPNGTLGIGTPIVGSNATSNAHLLDVAGQSNFRDKILVGGKNSGISNPQAVFAAPSNTGKALNVFGKWNGAWNTAEYGTVFNASNSSLHIGDVASGEENVSQSINFFRQGSGQTFVGHGGTPAVKNDFFVATNINGNFTHNYSAPNGQVLKGDGTTFHASIVNPSDLGQQSATTGQTLKWNGTQWSPADAAIPETPVGNIYFVSRKFSGLANSTNPDYNNQLASAIRGSQTNTFPDPWSALAAAKIDLAASTVENALIYVLPGQIYTYGDSNANNNGASDFSGTPFTVDIQFTSGTVGNANLLYPGVSYYFSPGAELHNHNRFYEIYLFNFTGTSSQIANVYGFGDFYSYYTNTHFILSTNPAAQLSFKANSINFNQGRIFYFDNLKRADIEVNRITSAGGIILSTNNTGLTDTLTVNFRCTEVNSGGSVWGPPLASYIPFDIRNSAPLFVNIQLGTVKYEGTHSFVRTGRTMTNSILTINIENATHKLPVGGTYPSAHYANFVSLYDNLGGVVTTEQNNQVNFNVGNYIGDHTFLYYTGMHSLQNSSNNNYFVNCSSCLTKGSGRTAINVAGGAGYQGANPNAGFLKINGTYHSTTSTAINIANVPGKTEISASLSSDFASGLWNSGAVNVGAITLNGTVTPNSTNVIFASGSTLPVIGEVQKWNQTLKTWETLYPGKSASSTIDFPSIAANTAVTQTVTVTGVTTQDIVNVQPVGGVLANCLVTAFASASNTVTVSYANLNGVAVDPPSATFNLVVTKW